MTSQAAGSRFGPLVAAGGLATVLLAGACTSTGSGVTAATPAAPPESASSSGGSRPSTTPVASELVADVVLVPNPECRNGGTATVGSDQWHVLVSQPASWRDQDEVVGTLDIRGERGLFTDTDDHIVAVTRGPVDAMCDVWPGD